MPDTEISILTKWVQEHHGEVQACLSTISAQITSITGAMATKTELATLKADLREHAILLKADNKETALVLRQENRDTDLMLEAHVKEMATALRQENEKAAVELKTCNEEIAKALRADNKERYVEKGPFYGAAFVMSVAIAVVAFWNSIVNAVTHIKIP